MQSFHTNDTSPQIVGIVAFGCVNLISDVWCRKAKFFGVYHTTVTRIGKGLQKNFRFRKILDEKIISQIPYNVYCILSTVYFLLYALCCRMYGVKRKMNNV